MFSRICLLCVAILSFSFAHASPSNAQATQTLLVVGDSLSAAYNLNASQGWVALMAERLAHKNPSWQVINASINGDTTSGGLTRLPLLLNTHRPQWVMLELGANDGLRGLPLKTIRSNLEKLIQQSQQSGAKVILIGTMLPPNYGSAYTTPFTAMYEELAAEYRLPIVPFLLEGVATERHLMQQDGLHPNAAAQPKILEHVWSVFAPLID